jgi:pimeloyl-ACP methyl ester carboxylesterase
MRFNRRFSTLFFAALVSACGSMIPEGSKRHPTTEEMPVKQMRVNGVDLAYVEAGKGETVVFVHGSAGDWRNWEGLRPVVAEKYHFVSLSLRYHYPNAWADDGRNYSMKQHVEDVAAFIRALNDGKVHLVGNSYGGRVVGYVALQYPELLRSVVMGEPSIIAPTSAEGKAALAAIQKDQAKTRAAAKAGDAKRAVMLLWAAVLDDPDAFQKFSPAQQQRSLDNANTLALSFADVSRPSITCEQLGALKVPALVMRGENTRASFRFGNEMLVSCLPKGTATAIVPNAPHNWFAANPYGAAKAILAFMQQH